MRKTNWSVVVIVGIIAFLLLFLAGMFSGWGMMGSGMMGRWGYSPFAWTAMIFMWLIPIGLIVLAGLGIVWLIRSLGGFGPPALDRPCPDCAKGVQANWQNCPYCGTSLK